MVKDEVLHTRVDTRLYELVRKKASELGIEKAEVVRQQLRLLETDPDILEADANAYDKIAQDKRIRAKKIRDTIKQADRIQKAEIEHKDAQREREDRISEAIKPIWKKITDKYDVSPRATCQTDADKIQKEIDKIIESAKIPKDIKEEVVMKLKQSIRRYISNCDVS
ncbi:MAG: hypothetical protein GY861_17075 [bacterium]|nr:hypothetical protein [bacterium]